MAESMEEYEASDDDGLSEFEEEFSCDELLDLAKQIEDLNLPGDSSLFADRMLACKNGYYSRSFYETAIQMEYLKDGGMSFEDAARELAGRIPAVEDLSLELEWGNTKAVRKSELKDFAAGIHRLGLNGPDGRLVKRIIGTKAAKGDWKLMALRYLDIERRLNVSDYYKRAFYEDQGRVDKEFAELRKGICMVVIRGNDYCVQQPLFPPWRDIEEWSKQLKGYGIDYELKDKQTTAEQNLLNHGVPNVASLDAHRPVLLHDLFLHLANKKTFATARNVPTDEVVEVEDEDLENDNPNMLDKQCLLNHGANSFGNKSWTDVDRKKVTSDIHTTTQQISCFLTEETLHSSSNQTAPSDLQLTEPSHKTDHGMMKAPCTRQLSTEESACIRAEKDFIITAEKTATDFLQICDYTDQSKDAAADHMDLQASDITEQGKKSAASHSSIFEKEFPLLPNQKPAEQNQKQNSTEQDRDTNVWAEKRRKKSYMNAGLGGKLERTVPSSPSYLVDVNKAFTVQDIWGHSLLGQYVGHHPGHFLINTMIKGWGVKAKYKLEEGWYIFSFNSEEDQEKILLGGPYLINGRPMIMKHIPDKFAFNKRDVANVPLWVRIYGLASRFWTAENLGGIASYIGNPMYMDPVTESRKRNAYARVLVEINLAAQITRKVPITFSDGDSIEVSFLVENEPKFCPKCCSFGHDIKECIFNKKKAAVGVKVKLGKAQTQLNLHSSELHTDDTGIHKATQENISTTMHTSDAHNHVDFCHNRTMEGRTAEQHTSQIQSGAGTNTKQNLRATSKQQRVWIEKEKDHQKCPSVAGRLDDNSVHSIGGKLDGSSSSLQGTAKSIPLSNSFDALKFSESITEETGRKFDRTAPHSTQETDNTHQARSLIQPATVT